MAEPVTDLSAPRTVHLVGIGGAGISAIGIILATMGHTVTGSDVNETSAWPSLLDAGVQPAVVAPGDLFASAHAHGAQIVAHSTAFPPTERDLEAASAAGCAVLDRAGILALICDARPTVAVSGTHGKTSTTAMLATLLDGAGTDPSYLVGAKPVGLGRAAHWSAEGSGAFVVEADESDGTFLRLGGDIAVVTNIDEDHLDYWRDIDAIEAAFLRFLDEARVGVVCIDDPRGEHVTDPRALRVARAVAAVTVGEGPEADLVVHSVQVERLHTTFGLRRGDDELGPVQVGTPGRHHARNAAVAIAVAMELGVPSADAVAAIGAYTGVARRFEVLGEAYGATFVDDYAHNPGKVRALLGAAKEADWSRVVAVFQPHRYTRTRDLLGDFGAALALADVVAITEVYAAGEAPIPGVTGRSLIEEVLDVRPWAGVAWVPTLDDAAAWLRGTLQPGDLCLTVGAGDVSGLGRRLVAEAGDGSFVTASPDAIDALAARLPGTVRREVPTGPLTTYGAGGPAALALTVRDDEDLAAVARAVAGTDGDVPVLVVGLGSNLLVCDDGFDGLVLVLGPAFAEIAIEGTSVRAGARAKLPVVARQTAGAGLTGFEWAAGVPGSVGGAVRMNAGVPEAEIGDCLTRVRVVDLASGEDGVVPVSELSLGYRTSSIRPEQVVVWAELELAPADPEVARAAIKEKTQWRRDNQPGGRNAGSVFTNPEGTSAGRLIDEAGLKGLRIGTAEVSPKHANFIQSDEGGRAQDIWDLMVEVRRRVHDQTGIVLHQETCLIGFPEMPELVS